MPYHFSFDLSFTKNTFTGKYYALEGIDGSGKTTQADKLGAYFKSKGKDVLITKEPSNGPIGLLIKEILNSPPAGGGFRAPPISLQYLFAADRGIHIETEVIPALQSGINVISDRSFWSSAAYGVADLSSRPLGRDDKERLLVAFNILSIYHGFLIPDKTFVISVPAEMALQRIDNRNSEHTLYEQQEKLNNVQKEYKWLAGEFGEYLTLIDGTQTKGKVFDEIIKSINNF